MLRVAVWVCLVAFVAAQSVVVLNSDNFDETINGDLGVLVKFYAPWCGHCKHLAPVYIEAATELGARGILAEVDCTVEGDLCQKYDVQGYPTLKYFSKGKATEYNKGRTAKEIVNFMVDQSKPSVTVVATAAEFDAFVAESSSSMVVVLGLFSDAHSVVFGAVADSLRGDGFSFASSSDASLAAKYNVQTLPAIVAVKTFGEPAVTYSADMESIDEITMFLEEAWFPLVGEIGPDNFQKYVSRGRPLVYLFLDLSKKSIREPIVAAARELAVEYPTLSFVEINGVKFARHGENLGMKYKAPGVVLHDMNEDQKFIFPEENLPVTKESLSAFIAAWTAKTIEPFYKSEPVPASNDKPVKTVVRLNFDAVVNDASKDVLVEFYAPWCGHCKELKPKYEKLGEQFKDDNGVTIAMCDATSNDVTIPNMKIEGFPTIVFFPANNKQNPVVFEGDRTTEAMAEFVTAHRTTHTDGTPHEEL